MIKKIKLPLRKSSFCHGSNVEVGRQFHLGASYPFYGWKGLPEDQFEIDSWEARMQLSCMVSMTGMLAVVMD